MDRYMTLLVGTSSAALAQSVERKGLNLVVAGSSPAGGVIFNAHSGCLLFCVM